MTLIFPHPVRVFFSSFFALSVIGLACASDEPSFAPMMNLTSDSLSPSASPSIAITAALDPDFCANTPEFSLTEWNRFEGEWHLQTMGCDDILVDCYEFGNLGQVKDHCCKCRDSCVDQCNEAVFTEPIRRDDSSIDGYGGFFSLFVPVAILVGLCVVLGLYLLRRKERLIAEANLATRRQHQLEGRGANGLTAEENANLRFEQFVTRFHFQIVLPDKSNISAETIRQASRTKKDEETPTEKCSSNSFDEDGESSADVVKEIPTRNIISEQLASWTKPAAKDECCICLECYTKGETICAPATKRCDHVFHESCIKEWLREQDQCPLCRVDLLKD
ncbi:unnamed protein product [Cylindrotheca closterium]|uniref:RING-type domain-containing protein n=1 Tax=Cylindrotheca closterium TaxID=2856 RepID=A0AAD2G178_9STRA|nr:unnamed protein product [Cylindrotheca closterium]